ncbi:MAG: amidohydrolase family protein [Bacteroidetes bacterium]|nr:amidohydrolase family protein [Bacteroidota bacterium]
MKKIIIYISLFICSIAIQAETTVFVGATIHIGNGQVIENGVLAIDSNKIIYVGKDGDGATFKNAKYIQVKGKHIYPGIIAPYCRIGLSEVEAARPTRDFVEVGDFNPNVNTQIAFNSDSKLIPTLRFNGILFVQSTPAGNTIPGSSSVMNLSGYNWEESTVLGNDGIHINWEETYGIANSAFDDRHKVTMLKLSAFFDEAQAYCKLDKVDKANMKYESMRQVLNGTRNIYIRVNTERGIKEAISFCKIYNLKPVLVEATQSYKVLDELKANNISLVLMNIHRLPTYSDEDVNISYKLPGMLKKAGINFCMGIEGSWEVRNISFQAGTAAAWGLTKEEAIQAITLEAAKILKVDSKIGSIEVNKSASFVVSEGNILEMSGNEMLYIYIEGNELPVNDMQQQLYQKYHKKYFGTEGQ